MPPLAQRLAAEALGTAFLLAAVIGSGIMAQKLSGGNVASCPAETLRWPCSATPCRPAQCSWCSF
jgi:hypothetical protein